MCHRLVVRVLLLASILPAASALAERTVGILQHGSQAAEGYTLFAPLASTNTWLIDNDGRVVHQWTATVSPGDSARLLPNGRLLRTGKPSGISSFNAGGAGGRIELITWDSTLAWSWDYSDSTVRQHHDAVSMPNGNILLVAWELKTGAEALAAGREPGSMATGELWPDHVIEVHPSGTGTGTIVWEWHAWDHLVQDVDPTKPNYGDPADHPGRLDLNHYQTDHADWLHTNSIAYHPGLDQIMLSSRNFNEIWIIDHDTTTAEAAGEAGDLLYRWGNPAAWGQGTTADQQFFGQHDAHWIEPNRPGAGNILVFNNGNGHPSGNSSRVEELDPPLNPDGTYALNGDGLFDPAAGDIVAIGDPPSAFYSAGLSGSQRQPNGNTLTCLGGQGTFIEFDSSGNEVWRYQNPEADTGPLQQGENYLSAETRVFRAYRYAADSQALAGRDLTPGNPLELYPPLCPGDLSGDDIADVEDVLAILEAWGTGVGDVTGDGQTTVDDLLVVIAAWNGC